MLSLGILVLLDLDDVMINGISHLVGGGKNPSWYMDQITGWLG
jgi:hypothetical protein